MKPTGTFPKIAIDETMRETVQHGSAEFPFEYYLEDVWEFDLHCVDWHWHSDVEFVRVRSGTVQYSVGGETRALHPGEGLFVNSRALHRFCAESSTVIPNFVFSPSLLAPEGGLVYQRHIQPILSYGPPFLELSPEISWQAEILARMSDVFELWEGKRPDPLRTQRLLLELWEILSGHVELSQSAQTSSSGNQARLQVMMQYIHERFAQHVTLDDIAACAYVSKSSARQIFQEGIRLSPVAYLIRYRLNRAAALLSATEKSVSAIAEETGFQSAGYFCRRFRELFGISPAAYRRQKQGDLQELRPCKSGNR